ncbi:unnamed protein product [Strongylus vulgaris]|uniref:5'-AMP-activated protein kinase subunit beta-1 n=1 Tax=Strongylus vulgaris TaxID=40348 RepID=A0A3P7ISB4_STRVU|nr:unnamed protein product [Strongylus vulgaris]
MLKRDMEKTNKDEKPVLGKEPTKEGAGAAEDLAKDVKCRVVIRWHYSKANEPRRVYVCGSWDGWDSHIRLYRSDDVFSTVLHLSPGYYEFKFFVDNEWMTNEHLPFTDVGYYSKNIITVKEEEPDVAAEEKNAS